MKIIVTGGAGFIASHITDAYIKAGHRVVIIDDLSHGFAKNINPKAKFYKADIRNRATIESIFKKEKPEVVNHHAAIAVIAEALRDPIPTLDVNLLGTTNVLIAFGKYGHGKNKKIIFSSSGAVYGTQRRIPVTEQTPTMPESAYGLSKLLGEELIEFYARQYGFHYVLFRYPNVYGPRQNPKGEAGITAIFGGLMKQGKTPKIFGDGSKGRDYTFVDDIVRANVFALKRGGDQIFTLGRAKVTTDQQIFDALAREIGFAGRPVYLPFRKGEAYRVCLSAGRAEKILGWKPKVSLEEGIREVVKKLSV